MNAAKEFLSTLNWVDYVILVAFLRGAYVGYKEGIIAELLRAFAYVAALLAALGFSPYVAELIQSGLGVDADVARAAGIAVLFALVFLILKLVGIVILKVTKSEPSFLFNFLGLLAGVARWAVILSAVFMLVDRMHITLLHEDITLRSRFAPPFLGIAPTGWDYLQSVVPVPAPAAGSGA
jgi:uncharacterized membrane protein required for colicin V production